MDQLNESIRESDEHDDAVIMKGFEDEVLVELILFCKQIQESIPDFTPSDLLEILTGPSVFQPNIGELTALAPDPIPVA